MRTNDPRVNFNLTTIPIGPPSWSQGPPGPPGPQGPPGPVGPVGPAGPPFGTGVYLPLTGGTITPPAGQFNPLVISVPNLAGAWSDFQAGTVHPAMVQENFGTVSTPDDTTGVTSTLFYHQIEYYAGGPNMTGTRGGLRIHGALGPLSPNSPSNTVGIGQLAEITTPLGGTSPVRPNAKGGQYAYNPIMILRAGATNIRASQGIEVDNSWEAGSSGAVKGCFSAVSFNNDAVRGTEHDSAYNVSAVAGATGFGIAYAVTDVSGKFPLDTTDWVLQLISASAKTIAGGIDLTGSNNVGISGPAFLTRHVNIDGPTGNITTDGSVTTNAGTFVRTPNVVSQIGGNLSLGPTTAMATTATSAFPRMPTMAGPPTGNVAAGAFVFDSVNHQFNVSQGGGVWVTGGVGPQGPAGPTGPTGPAGAAGPAGPGVVAGGTSGQVLSKIDGTDYNTQWATPFSQTQTDALYLPLAGGTLTGPLAVASIDSTGIGMNIGPTTNNVMNLRTNNVARWQVSNSALLAVADGVYDIGGASSGRPRNINQTGYLQSGEQTTPTTPAAGQVRIYPKSDHRMYALDSTGAETLMGDVPFTGGTLTSPLLFSTDNTLDIGAVGATRPRTLFAGTSVIAPLFDATGGSVFSPTVQWTGSTMTIGTTTAHVILLKTTNVPRIQITNTAMITQSDGTYDLGLSAANRFRNLYLTGTVGVKVKAGTPVDTDFTSPVDGMLAVDSTANKIWARVGGVWKGVVIA